MSGESKLATSEPRSDAFVGRPITVLVDFDNAFPPWQTLTPAELRHELLSYVSDAMRCAENADVVRIRLYGGWHSGGLLTNRGSDVAQLAALADPFPVPVDARIVAGTVELASALLGGEAVLDDTYRRRASVPRLRLAESPVPAACQEGSEGQCPARILARFTKGASKLCPVDGCSVTARDAFVEHQQKMIDTAMTCDLIELATDDGQAGLLLVTSDTDFLPPLLYAARRTAHRVCLRLCGPEFSEQQLQYLRDASVSVSGANYGT